VGLEEVANPGIRPAIPGSRAGLRVRSSRTKEVRDEAIKNS
jgi:hypothetical protein